ncbi:hypothetical protein JAAARDRAFT_161042 [Jaapia argillacea MUCL 33604]|uniref:Uncharacterized protein n=1 Tax=Jaapia argillacea MUCL 33604 TaxID=933084 RepID=A0A067PJT5_9AGAM|nr:hypothetical protein JAAARDRAFT_161042 [Jaapia argillacea MUCL 33604]
MSTTCRDIDRCRTMWGIVSSCLTTVFTCTWVAIHPNIPGPYESSFEITLRRVGMMIVALLAPELLVVWSLKQWLVARRLAKKHQDRKWTETHGFFALMGGFMLVDKGGKPVQLLHPEKLDKLHELDVEFPRITEGEILDKSKRDPLSKGLIMVQTTWFILQCAARWYEHLPITELEIATLAFTVLNLITYAFWWDKPVDVRHPHPIGKCSVLDTANNTSDRGGGGGGGGGGGAEEEVQHKQKGDPRNKGGFLRIRSTVGRFMHEKWEETRRYHSTFRPIMVLVVVLVEVFIDPFFSPEIRSGTEMQVPTFYSGYFDNTERDLIASISASVAALFGAIHCFAWSLQFPSGLQQLLWRVSALTITSTPIIEFLSFYIGSRFDYHYMVSTALYALILFVATAYIAARVTLLILAFASLRHLPPGAYEAVYWTTFIPHI